MRNVNADLCHSPFIEHDVKFKGTRHNKSFFDKLEDMAHVSYHTQRWQNRIFVARPEYLQYDRLWRLDNTIIAVNVKISKIASLIYFSKEIFYLMWSSMKICD